MSQDYRGFTYPFPDQVNDGQAQAKDVKALPNIADARSQY
jgi:hypothetical protein